MGASSSLLDRKGYPANCVIDWKVVQYVSGHKGKYRCILCFGVVMRPNSVLFLLVRENEVSSSIVMVGVEGRDAVSWVIRGSNILSFLS